MGKTSPCADHHAAIVRLSNEGHSIPEIAALLELPRFALQGYLKRRGLRGGKRRGRVPEIDRQAVRAMIEDQRMTQRQVAQELHCSLSAIERVCQLLRLETARTGPRSGQDHRGWKGGRCLDKHGYVEIYAPLHPHARKSNGRIAEHRLVMEVHLGRYLDPEEVVDHRDDHPSHNWPENLRAFATNADHLRATLTGREKSSRRSSIPGAYGCSQKIDHCPDEHETLGPAPESFRRALAEHIAIHRPTTEHAGLSRSSILRSGPIRPAFRYRSME